MLNLNITKQLLEKIQSGDIGIDDALAEISGIKEMGFASVDLSRKERCGFPEVIFAESKTPEQNVQIASTLLEKTGTAFLTRVKSDTIEALKIKWPECRINKAAKTALIGRTPEVINHSDFALVVSAGTSDQPVAEEAVESLAAFGIKYEVLNDVGVAGIHRILSQEKVLMRAAVIIVIAGMEGALPSVIGGLVSCPVIAVPTSVGYGASFQGVAALLGMLNSCASGVTVVNIDNGFGAACSATRIINTIHKVK